MQVDNTFCVRRAAQLIKQGYSRRNNFNPLDFALDSYEAYHSGAITLGELVDALELSFSRLSSLQTILK